MKKIFSVVFAITLIFTSCASPKSPPEKQEKNDTIIGTWINYNEIGEIVNNSANQDEFEKNVRKILTSLKQYSVNTVFLHCRAFDDCFYKSEMFPASDYCKNEQNNLKFDVLSTFLKIGHREKMKIHAWINPYRISNKNDIDKLPTGFLPQTWYNEDENNQRLIISENGIYYNPASLEVQKHIIDGVKEIIKKYDVDGIHFDDYFYPESSKDIDGEYYKEYVESGGKLSLEDYRRQCVSSLIAAVYSAVKNFNESLIFSVSPSGSIDDNYNKHFADVRLWCNQKGYVDYIVPQIYYGFNHQKYPFEKTAQEWETLAGENRKVIFGLPLYKIGKIDRFAGTGANEWTKNDDIIARQIQCILNNKNSEGFSFYSASMLYKDEMSQYENVELENIKSVLNEL